MSAFFFLLKIKVNKLVNRFEDLKSLTLSEQMDEKLCLKEN